MQKISFSVAMFLSTITANFAQENLKAGYVVRSEGDTVRGSINFREWLRSPRNVELKSVQDQTIRTFAIHEIRSFHIKGLHIYERHRVRVSLDSYSAINFGKDTTSTVEDVFLRVHLKGRNVSLFSYQDGIKLRWYIARANQDVEPFELLNSIYRVGSASGPVASEKQYRSQLMKLVREFSPDSERLIHDVQTSAYAKSAMIAIAERINGRNDTEIRKRLKMDSKVRYYVGLGGSKATVWFSGPNRYTGPDLVSSIAPMLNVGMDIFPEPAVGKLYIRNNVSVSGFKSKTAPVEVVYPGQLTETYQVRLNQVNFNFHSQLGYNVVNNPHFKWTMAAGGGINVSFYPVNEESFVRVGINPSSTKEKYVQKFRNIWFNPSFRTGITVRQMEYVVAYLPSSLLAWVSFSGIRSSSINFAVNYRLKWK